MSGIQNVREECLQPALKPYHSEKSTTSFSADEVADVFTIVEVEVAGAATAAGEAAMMLSLLSAIRSSWRLLLLRKDFAIAFEDPMVTTPPAVTTARPARMQKLTTATRMGK